MNNDNLTEVLRSGMRVVFGAATVVVETLQDPQRRTDTFDEWQRQIKQKAEELALKGEVTEQEVRTKANEWLSKYQSKEAYTTTTSSYVQPVVNTPSPNRGVQTLTEQIIALRIELENLRKPS